MSILLFLWLSVAARAETSFLTLDPACRCDAYAEDVFEVPMRITAGGLAGQCVNTCRFQPAHWVAERNDGVTRVGNFLHDNRYYQADVPLPAVEYVNVLFEDFYYGISHVFLRFEFREPIALASQRRADFNAPAGFARALVVSPEAALAAGQGLSFWSGAVGDYPLVFRVLSLEEMKRVSVGKLHHRIRQFRLELNPEQAQNLLRFALERSEKAGFSETYWLLSHNCATSVTDLLQQAAGLSPDWLSYPDRAIPYGENAGTVRWLRSAGLLNELVPLPNLEDDL